MLPQVIKSLVSNMIVGRGLRALEIIIEQESKRATDLCDFNRFIVCLLEIRCGK